MIHSIIFFFLSVTKFTNSSSLTNPDDVIRGFATKGNSVMLNTLIIKSVADISIPLSFNCFSMTGWAI